MYSLRDGGQITENIKNAFKYNITKCYLEVINENSDNLIIHHNNYLKDINFDDCRHEENEGIIGTTIAKELTGNFVNVDSTFNIENKEIKLYIGACLDNSLNDDEGKTDTEIINDPNVAWIKYGTFIVQKPENDNVRDNTSFEALDYMIKFNKPFENTLNYDDPENPITLGRLLQNVCEQAGVPCGTTIFRNSTYQITQNYFTEGESCRDVLKAIAQIAFSWARINENDELVLDFNLNNTVQEEFDSDEYYDLKFNDTFGPVNTIILRNSQVEGENYTIHSNDYIEGTTEPIELVIADNPFAYTQDTREELIQAGNAIFGFEYTPITTKTIGAIYLNCLDKIRIKNMQNEYYETYIFNNKISYNGTIKDEKETPALTKTETKYKFTGDLKKAIRKTEIVVDKVNQEIRSEIRRIDGNITTASSQIATLEGWRGIVETKGGNNLFYYNKEFWIGGDVTTTTRRNIQVGDDLSGKKIYLSFPTTEPLSVIEIASNYIITCSNGAITHEGVEEGGSSTERVSVTQNTVEIDRIYSMRNGNYLDGETEYTLPSDFGTVTTINSSSEIYQYIEIEEQITQQVLNIEEYTNTEIKTNSVSGRAYIVNQGSSYQDTIDTKMAVPNGMYTVSFKYKRIGSPLANVSIKINDERVLERRNLKIGDVLSGKNLYFNFPKENDFLQQTSGDIAVGNNGYSISLAETTDAETGDIYKDILVKENGLDTIIYRYNTTTSEVINNSAEYILSDNFGEVTSINSSLSPYLYIKSLEIKEFLETNWTTFSQTVEVKTNHLKIEIISDLDNTLYLADLMGNVGEEPEIWTQNANETRTDTVTIGKGIQVESSDEKNVYTRIDADGNRTINKATGEVVSEQTDKGLKVKELIVREKAEISGLLIQQVGNQTWISSLL